MLLNTILFVAIVGVFLPSIQCGLATLSNLAEPRTLKNSTTPNNLPNGEPNYKEYAKVARFIVHKSGEVLFLETKMSNMC